MRQHFLRKIAQSIPRRLFAHPGTAGIQGLPGEGAGKFVAEPFILAKHKPNLAGAYPNIARRNVGIRPNVFGQLCGKALAEAHDLALAFVS